MSEFRSNNNASRFFQPWNRVIFYSMYANNPRVNNTAVSETELCTDEAKMGNHCKTQRSDADTDIPNSFQRTNVVHYLRAMEKGQYHPPNSAKALKCTLVKRLHLLRLHPFHMSLSQNVSAFTWHPTFPNVLLAGSRKGEIAIHNNGYVVNSHLQTREARIITFKFHPQRPSKAYLVYSNGIELLDFHEERIMPVVNSRSCLWLTSFDCYPNQNMFVCGDSKGDLHFRDENGKKIYNSKHVHQNKITHIEFSHKDTNIYATASRDHTVKIWDVRMMPNGHTVKPLSTLVHETGVNSACFSPTDFSSLLTTDYHSNLHIYSTGPWDLKLMIAHRYRHRQLMSTKASWHPLCDIIVVGHSCKILQEHSIEFYDADTGNLLRKMERSLEYSPSLCSLNSQGDILAAQCGHRITFYEFIDAHGKINHLTWKTSEGH